MKTVKRLRTILIAALAAVGLTSPNTAFAAEKNQNVMCLKTNTGNYYPVIRVSMMVSVDASEKFEIVLKDGQGEAGVSSVSFENHSVMVDLDKYKVPNESDPAVEYKVIYLMTNTGKYFSFKSFPTLKPIEGTDKFDVVYSDATEPNVSKVWFYRGDNPAENIDGIFMPTVSEEKLQLMSPVRYQMQISGCGTAKSAQVYSLDGAEVAGSSVNDGVTTIQVGHLTPGVYVVKVGNKSLKFLKK